jgi:hypothetical protein
MEKVPDVILPVLIIKRTALTPIWPLGPVVSTASLNHPIVAPPLEEPLNTLNPLMAK